MTQRVGLQSSRADPRCCMPRVADMLGLSAAILLYVVLFVFTVFYSCISIFKFRLGFLFALYWVCVLSDNVVFFFYVFYVTIIAYNMFTIYLFRGD